MRLEGKVSIITGANSGVGAATAQKFAENGCSVVIAARRTAPLEEIATEITAKGGKLDPTVMGAIMAHNDLTLSPSIANVSLFLASDEARPITGQNIVCDFGVTL